MAALNNIRFLREGLLKSQAFHFLKRKDSLVSQIGNEFPASYSVLHRTQSQRKSLVKVYDTPALSTITESVLQLRQIQTSTALAGRFQRSALTPEDVDWSKMNSLNSTYKHSFDPSLVERLLNEMDESKPVDDMPDPFEKNYRRCFLCKHDIHLDHKNVRLLSQFVSPYTGRIYGRAITGLCIPMQKRVAGLIKRARVTGYMPVLFKDPKYLQDPQPYDAMARK